RRRRCQAVCGAWLASRTVAHRNGIHLRGARRRRARDCDRVSPRAPADDARRDGGNRPHRWRGRPRDRADVGKQSVRVRAGHRARRARRRPGVMTMTRFKSARGTALLETAFVLPLVLLISVAIFEFGRAYETMQVLTNAAREGARVAVLPNQQPDAVQTRVKNYMALGGL